MRDGKVFAVQKWIADQRPLFSSSSPKRPALEIAVRSGFHAMVELLAPVWPDKPSMLKGVRLAARAKRADLIWILLEHGVDVTDVELRTIAECQDKGLMRHFLDRWDEVGKENGLLDIIREMPRPLIGLIREYAQRIPGAQKQLAIALKDFIEDEHPKWIALTMWMGADPRLAAPDPRWPDDDPEEWSTALEYAVTKGNLEAFKLLKPDPVRDDLNALLNHVFLLNHTDIQVAEYLLEIGGDINNKSN